MRALTVDDSRVVRRLVAKVLESLGFEVAEAANGEEALLHLLQYGGPDLIVLDWNMPEMGGLEFLTRMRKMDRFRDARVIMLTARNDLPSVEKAINAGANEYLMKPFAPDALAEKIRLVGLSVQVSD